MQGAVDAAALEAELGQLTGLTFADFADLERCAPDDRAMMLDGWRQLGRMSWAASPSTVDRVVAILTILAAIASPLSVVTGGVSGVAGAAAAIKNL